MNTETAQDNAFQARLDHQSFDLAGRAYEEHSAAMVELERRGVRVRVFEGLDPATPDSVFPNNWFSTHAGGHVAIYPKKTTNRRQERRPDVIEMLTADYRVKDVIDYSGLEPDRLYHEGTGAMVLDHIDRVAYAVESDRTNPSALERFCTHFNFELMVFPAADSRGVSIYHTNVLMCIGTDFAMLGVDLITNEARREEVIARLEKSGREVIRLSAGRIAAFAGNAIELQGRESRLLALSQTARSALEPAQIAVIAVIEKSARHVPLAIPTIEMAGGSVRCAIAGIHLAQRR